MYCTAVLKYCEEVYWSICCTGEVSGFAAAHMCCEYCEDQELSPREVLNGVESELLRHVSLRHLSKRLLVFLQQLEDGGQLLTLHSDKRTKRSRKCWEETLWIYTKKEPQAAPLRGLNILMMLITMFNPVCLISEKTKIYKFYKGMHHYFHLTHCKNLN